MGEPSTPPIHIVRFSVFELNLRSGELRRAGTRINLQEQSFQTLVLLLEHPGDVVTREELRQRLWPADTFVDFERGLNAAIKRLRDTLGDSAESPRFVETLHRRGYRFIAPVELDAALANRSDEAAAETANDQPGTQSVVVEQMPAGRATPLRGWIGKGTAIGIAAVILAVASIALFRKAPPATGAPARIAPLTRLAGKEGWPAFAPDGEQVAFAWSGEKFDNNDIYVTLVGSTAVRRLTTDPADDYAPSWSPDGRRIAFLRRVGHSARIHVISALGGPDQQVSDFPVGASSPHSLLAVHITWSPDGRYVAAGRDAGDGVADDSAGLYLIPIEGGRARPITRPKPPTFHFSPVFSPDGRRVTYASCEIPRLSTCAVNIVDVDRSFTPASAARKLTSQPVYPAGMAWSRDGKSILFVGEGSSSWNLWRLWIDGTREPETIELAGGKAEHPATAASRDRLVFSQYDWGMHMYRFAPGKPLERVAASSSSEYGAHFSPDGRRIAFSSGRSGEVAIWVAAADGSEPRQLTSHQWNWQGSPNWSPDGRTIAFDAHDPDGIHVWTIPAEGGTPRRVTKPTGDQTTPTWSRDGKWIYFSEAHEGRVVDRDIWRVPATGGPAEQLTRTGSGFLGYETADGASLLYQPKVGDSPLLVMPLTGAGPPRRLIECVRHGCGSFIPVGTTIFYVGCEPGTSPSLRSIDLLNGRDRLLGTLEHSPPDQLGTYLAVSPDRETILFQGLLRHGADLMMIENFR
jgi:Tol biopolymer transport system component/DNA-binding winged helix-turn-helix (wHTH) protein